MPFLTTYCSFVALQFTLYETIVDYYKKTLSPEVYKQRETPITCMAGAIAGCVAAALTNSLEAITVVKQTNPDANIGQLIQKERFSLLTKGLFARVYYNGFQSLFFFTLVMQIGKIYDVELNDD